MELIMRLDDIAIRHERRQIDPREVYLVSRSYDYRMMQLIDMTPGSPNLNREPYDGLPAPHLMIGYQYMHKALNDYYFDNRVFMQLGFTRTYGSRQPRLYWTCLTDCSYTVDVGRYMQFLDLDNFNETFEQMHNSVLMDRIAADMGQLRGRGFDTDDPSQQDIVTTLSGSGASGLTEDTAMRLSSKHDANLLAAIRRLRVALTNYIFCWYYDRFNTQSEYRYIPFSEVFLDENWLTDFVEVFGDLDARQLVEEVSLQTDPSRASEVAETMAKSLMSTLVEAHNPISLGPLKGGAIQLRNRRITSRQGLRPRDPTGRAITSSTLRQMRRRVTSRFRDRLPNVTRRTRYTPIREDVEIYPENEFLSEMDTDEENFEDSSENFIEEVVETVLGAIRSLREELSPTSRRHQLFQFGNEFYRLLLDSKNSGIVTDSFLRKWVLYFFLSEHIASTLYYCYVKFHSNKNFTKFVSIETLQVLITGWDVHARQVFKRIWSEQNANDMFEKIWSRILLDFTMMVEKTGQFAGMDEADQHLFLSDIQYRDKSGDIDDVLNQLNLSEELIENIDISFRIKFKGITAISTNKRIQANLRRAQI
uniref:PTP n=1 Tax=Pacific black duck aviadenovirus TaxID=2798287 RepID=A0A7T4V793_9ADEN|nr:pTP [Pacific black duck aviadenovirus]